MRRYVDTYKFSEEEMVIRVNSSNTLYIKFDEIFKLDSNKYKNLNTFVIGKKKAYCNNVKKKSYTADNIAKYINFFIRFYDCDSEILMAYCGIKYRLESIAVYPAEIFIADLYEMILTPTVMNKIDRMTEDESYIEITNEKEEKEFENSPIQFTGAHAKILMNMSMAMKLFIPVMCHYIHSNAIKDVSQFILSCYDRLLSTFEGDVDIYNKLYETANSIILHRKQSDKELWAKLEILGKYTCQVTESLTHKIITDIMPKYVFERNIIKFNFTVINEDLERVMTGKFNDNLKEYNITKKDAEGFSGFDKIEVNMIKQDESIFIIGNVIVNTTLEKLLTRFNITYEQEDLDFYIENITVTLFQRNLVFLFFAKYFGSSKILFNVNQIGYSILIIILQELLTRQKFQYMQFLLSGRVKNNELISKKIINKKQMSKLQQSVKFQDIVNNKYKFAYDIIESGEVMYKYAGELLSSNFGLAYHKYKSYLGRRIIVNKDELCDEFLKFVEMI